MKPPEFPVIDVVATGQNILALRKALGYTVGDLQRYLNLDSPQAIYYWQQGKFLPTVDHLYALSYLFGVSINTILVEQRPPAPDTPPGKHTLFSHMHTAPCSFDKESLRFGGGFLIQICKRACKHSEHR